MVDRLLIESFQDGLDHRSPVIAGMASCSDVSGFTGETGRLKSMKGRKLVITTTPNSHKLTYQSIFGGNMVINHTAVNDTSGIIVGTDEGLFLDTGKYVSASAYAFDESASDSWKPLALAANVSWSISQFNNYTYFTSVETGMMRFDGRIYFKGLCNAATGDGCMYPDANANWDGASVKSGDMVFFKNLNTGAWVFAAYIGCLIGTGATAYIQLDEVPVSTDTLSGTGWTEYIIVGAGKSGLDRPVIAGMTTSVVSTSGNVGKGEYFYRCTYENSRTACMSNSSTDMISVLIQSTAGSTVTLSIPAATRTADMQADKLHIWRTVGADAVLASGFTGEKNQYFYDHSNVGTVTVQSTASNPSGSVTIYGITNSGQMRQETFTGFQGAGTAKVSAYSDWNKILGVDAVTSMATVTVKKQSNSFVCVSFLGSLNSIGRATVDGSLRTSGAFRLAADGATTDHVVLVGVDSRGVGVTAYVQLNGSNPVNVPANMMAINLMYIGDLDAGRKLILMKDINEVFQGAAIYYKVGTLTRVRDTVGPTYCDFAATFDDVMADDTGKDQLPLLNTRERPKNFTTIRRYNDKLWGTIKGDPNIYWSKSNAPEYWTTVRLGEDFAELRDDSDGGYEPIGDGPGDDILAIVAEGGAYDTVGRSGSNLAIFTRKRLIRWFGSSYADFYRSDAIPVDCVAGGTVANVQGRLVFLSSRGLMLVDTGSQMAVPVDTAVNDLLPDSIQSGSGDITRATAAVWREWYILSYCKDDGLTGVNHNSENNTTLKLYMPTMKFWAEPIASASFRVWHTAQSVGELIYMDTTDQYRRLYRLNVEESGNTYWTGTTGVACRWRSQLADMITEEVGRYEKKHPRSIRMCWLRPKTLQSIQLAIYAEGETYAPLWTAAVNLPAQDSTHKSGRIYLDVPVNITGTASSDMYSLMLGVSGTFTSQVELENIQVDYSVHGRK